MIFRKIIKSLFFTLIVTQTYALNTLASETTLGDSISLSDAVRIGLKVNPSIQSEMIRLEQSQTQVDIEEWNYWPSIDLSTGPDQLNGDNFGYQVVLTQTIYDWGVKGNEIDMAKEKYLKQAEKVHLLREESSLDIIDSYFELYFYRKKLESAIEYNKSLKEILVLANDRFDKEFSDASELKKAINSESASKKNLESIQANVYKLEWKLNILLNEKVANRELLPSETNVFTYLNLPGVLESTISKSPKYLQEKLEMDMDITELKKSHNSWKPQLVLQAKKLKNQRSTGGTLVDDSNITVVFKLSLPNGLSTIDNIKLNSQKVTASKWKLSSVARDLKEDFYTNYEIWNSIPEQREELKKQIYHSYFLKEVYEDQFNSGLKSIDDLININSQIYKTKQESYDLHLKYYTLPYQTASSLGLLDSVFLNNGFLREH